MEETSKAMRIKRRRMIDASSGDLSNRKTSKDVKNRRWKRWKRRSRCVVFCFVSPWRPTTAIGKSPQRFTWFTTGRFINQRPVGLLLFSLALCKHHLNEISKIGRRSKIRSSKISLLPTWSSFLLSKRLGDKTNQLPEKSIDRNAETRKK